MLWWTLRQLKSSKWQVRADAARLLGESDQKKAVPALIAALADENPAVRLAVTQALVTLRHPATAEPLAQSLAALSRRAKNRRSDEPAFSPHAEYEALAQALGVLGTAAVPPLLRQLNSEEKETRRWAAHALGLARDPRSVPPLVKMLADSRSDVRKAVALALGEIADAQALEPLIAALANRDPETRRAAAVALGSIGRDGAVDALRAVMEDPNEPVQLAVVEALRKIGGLCAGRALRAAIDDGRKSVSDAAKAALESLKFAPRNAEERATAALLLGDFPAAVREGEAAAGAFIETLASRDAQRRRMAAAALASLALPSAMRPLLGAMKDHDASVQDAAAKAVAAIGPAALAGLEELLTHHDPSVQRLAARSLGDIGDPRATGALVGIIGEEAGIAGDRRESLEVIRAAAAALEHILSAHHDELPIEELERIAALPDVVCRNAAGTEEEKADCSVLRDLARQAMQR